MKQSVLHYGIQRRTPQEVFEDQVKLMALAYARETVIASASLQVTPVVDLWESFASGKAYDYSGATISPGSATGIWDHEVSIGGVVIVFNFYRASTAPRANILVAPRCDAFRPFKVPLNWVGEPKYRERPPKDIWMYVMAKALLDAQERSREVNQ